MASKVSATPESCPVNWPADAPRAQVVMTEGPGQSATWHLTEPMTIVGWGGASTLQPDDRSMSKMQCLLVHTGRHLLLRDLHSPNPTRLNGERTSIAALSDGDRISMGQTTLTVHLESTGVPEPDPGHDALSMPGRLELADTASAEKAVLEKAVTLLGRRESLDIYLEDTAISPAHAVIFPFNNRPMIRDLGSRTGFEVNGGLRTFCLLNDGDRLHVGPFEVNVRLEAWPDEIPSAASAPPTESDTPPKEPLADSPPPAPEPAPAEGLAALRGTAHLP